jgi:hypothetical protein
MRHGGVRIWACGHHALVHSGHDGAGLGDVGNASGRPRVHLHGLAGHALGVRDLPGRNRLAVLHSGVLHCCGVRVLKGRRYHPVRRAGDGKPNSASIVLRLDCASLDGRRDPRPQKREELRLRCVRWWNGLAC